MGVKALTSWFYCWVSSRANIIADSLSRLVHGKAGVKPNEADHYITFISENAVPKATSIKEMEKESAVDQELSALRKAIQSDRPG